MLNRIVLQKINKWQKLAWVLFQSVKTIKQRCQHKQRSLKKSWKVINRKCCVLSFMGKVHLVEIQPTHCLCRQNVFEFFNSIFALRSNVQQKHFYKPKFEIWHIVLLVSLACKLVSWHIRLLVNTFYLTRYQSETYIENTPMINGVCI